MLQLPGSISLNENDPSAPVLNEIAYAQLPCAEVLPRIGQRLTQSIIFDHTIYGGFTLRRRFDLQRLQVHFLKRVVAIDGAIAGDGVIGRRWSNCRRWSSCAGAWN